MTSWGCYRYLRAHQGYLALWDGFTHRNQLTSQEIEYKVTLVDEKLVSDTTVEENFTKSAGSWKSMERQAS